MILRMIVIDDAMIGLSVMVSRSGHSDVYAGTESVHMHSWWISVQIEPRALLGSSVFKGI